MKRESTGSLFDEPDEPRASPPMPRWPSGCARARLEEFVGQPDLIGEKSLLGSALRQRGQVFVAHPLGTARLGQDHARAA